jgi:endonuclease YncB( thermonuclease family)
VFCEQRDIDRYGRIVAVCRAAIEDLGAWMVANGWALAYRRYSTAYVGPESSARAAGRGIWRGTLTAPWDWRNGVRTPYVP